ncbi:hypothetical protein GCM10023196_011300 [Actinoallomurus vinaceus]|uniref:TPM domain-containing protein n=1 Tax=Actinoallomurus vinaceus TaxID=1080074 RepID=A0ABP8U4R3_9ACTN
MSSDGAAIAAALRRSPVYVDPAYEGALPTARRERLVKRIRRSPIPIYVVLVPLVAGGTWQSSEQVTTVVRSHLGRDGAYVTLNTDFGDVFDVVMWGGSEEQRRSAHAAGWAMSLDRRYDKSSLADRLDRCVELIATGKGTEAYDQAHDQAFPPGAPTRTKTNAPGPHGVRHGDGTPVALPVAVAAAVLAGGGALLWLLRRRRARAAHDRLALPHRVFGTARQADEDELRARAERELIALGELLDDAQGDPSELGRALDAYTAAGKALDRAGSLADLAGVLVLVHLGRTPQDAPPLCYFDPRHGEGAIAVTWRAPGTRTRRDVRVCPRCARAVRDREVPDVLLDDGRPYYEAATIWAETGYGQFGDLVGRILRD